jgi:hypothetical protein
VSERPEPYFSNRDQAKRTALHQCEFIISKVDALRRVDRDGRAEKAVKDFQKLLKAGETLSKGQYSYLEGIYENTMRGMGLESVNVHSDAKQRSLRFGR